LSESYFHSGCRLEYEASEQNANPLAQGSSPAEWLAARKQFLTKEKEFTRLCDELSRQLREQPRKKVEKNCLFDGWSGKATRADLFDKRGQLIVYHYMFGPQWKEGCPSCSVLADHFDGLTTHLANRGTTLAVVSYASRTSKRSKSAWTGGSSGCHRSPMISTATITFPSPKKIRFLVLFRGAPLRSKHMLLGSL
jgi:hypothetical protein